MPPPAFALEGDKGVTNTRSPHWRRWLKPENRCLVPLTSFSEPGRDAAGKYEPVWFRLAGDDSELLAFFAGIWTPQWTSMRKLKEGEVTADLFGFLTCEPNAEVGAVHPTAMPVILTEPAEFETWMTAPGRPRPSCSDRCRAGRLASSRPDNHPGQRSPISRYNGNC